jgi:hypothetical protein
MLRENYLQWNEARGTDSERIQRLAWKRCTRSPTAILVSVAGQVLPQDGGEDNED